MPLTPLHLGVLAPFRGVSLWSFLWVNLWIDSDFIMAWWMDASLPSHDDTLHTLQGALIIAIIVTIPGMRSMRWALGAFIGACSHIFLDALVHPDIRPFGSVVDGNPLYLGVWGMPWISSLLIGATVWVISRYVSDIRGYVARLREQVRQRSR